MQRISLRSFLVTLLIILVIMTLVLLYLYFLISRPPGVPAYQSKHMKHLFSIYGYGSKEDELLYRPTDVAFDSEGNIYVADTGHSRVLMFRSAGQYIRTIGKKGTGEGELMTPTGVTVSKDGRVYVADKALSKVVVYDNRGRFKNEFKVMLPLKPYAANNKLYVTTYGHIMIYDLKGREIEKWGRKGRQKGNMDSPLGIAVSTKGKVYLSDTLNLRLQAFSREGKFLWVKGEPAKSVKAEDRAFSLPAGVVMDEKSLLYLVDAFSHSIKVLDESGKEIVELSRKGTREGEFNLPAGIAYDQNRIFAIADKYNDRVQVVKITIE